MQTAITLIVFITMIVFSKHILSSMLKYDPVIKEKYQIKYPIEPMSENYFDILEEIENCATEHDMKRAYIRIIIFSGCYPDSAMFLSELWMIYQEKELNIFS